MLVHEYYYWSADQEMAQRVISAKGLGDARVGKSYLFHNILIFYLFVKKTSSLNNILIIFNGQLLYFTNVTSHIYFTPVT